MITLDLVTIDADLYEMFLLHKENIGILVKNGILDQKSAKIKLHFDDRGRIALVELDKPLYKLPKGK